MLYYLVIVIITLVIHACSVQAQSVIDSLESKVVVVEATDMKELFAKPTKKYQLYASWCKPC